MLFVCFVVNKAISNLLFLLHFFYPHKIDVVNFIIKNVLKSDSRLVCSILQQLWSLSLKAKSSVSITLIFGATWGQVRSIFGDSAIHWGEAAEVNGTTLMLHEKLSLKLKYLLILSILYNVKQEWSTSNSKILFLIIYALFASCLPFIINDCEQCIHRVNVLKTKFADDMLYFTLSCDLKISLAEAEA